MKSRFVHEMHRFITENNMIQDGETVLIAVSGGADSMALLYGLHELQQELNWHLHVVHLNHCLRENSSDDAVYVHRHAEGLGLPYSGHITDVKTLAEKWKLSIESAGRKARYQLYDTVCADIGASKVALGHHKDDIAETVLMNLIRGGGSDGLKGIACFREGKYIRPLSTFTRQEIASYLKSINLIPKDDPTNTDTYYLRNRIRHELLPLLKSNYNPNITEGLNRTAAVVGEESTLLDGLTEQAFKHCLLTESQSTCIALNRETFLQNHIVIQRRILRHSVSQVFGTSRDFSFDHVKSILEIATSEKPNARISLPNGIQFRRAYEKLYFEEETKQTKNYEYPLTIPGRTSIEELNSEINSRIRNFTDIELSSIPNGKYEAMLDFCKIKPPLQVRNRRIGDRFQPHGMHGTKKIKDYFIDLKVPNSQRDRIPMVVCGKEILWVVGFTTNEQYKIQRETHLCLHLQYGKTENFT